MLEEQAEVVRLQTEKYARDKESEKLQINNSMGNFSKQCEKINEKISEFKSKAEEVTKEKLNERSKLAQINFAIFNLNREIENKYLISSSKSCNRKVSGVLPVKKTLSDFDDPEYATTMSTLML